MPQTARTTSTAQAIPVDHKQTIHEIGLATAEDPRPVTLLELIDAVSEVSDDEQEVLATVTYMLNSGRVQLTGNFRGTPPEQLCG